MRFDTGNVGDYPVSVLTGVCQVHTSHILFPLVGWTSFCDPLWSMWLHQQEQAAEATAEVQIIPVDNFHTLPERR